MTWAPRFPSMRGSNLVELVLLRHGIAEERLGHLDHPERALTHKGRQRTHAVLDALVNRGMVLDCLITSPYRRAVETAQLAVELGMAPSLHIDERLQPGGDSLALMLQLKGRIGLVGHEPDLGNLACALLGWPLGGLGLKKAGLVQLRQRGETWQLLALLRPSLLLEPKVFDPAA